MSCFWCPLTVAALTSWSTQRPWCSVVLWDQLFGHEFRYHSYKRQFYLPVTDNDQVNWLYISQKNISIKKWLLHQDDVWINDITGAEPSYFNWHLAEPNGETAENCTVLNVYNRSLNIVV